MTDFVLSNVTVPFMPTITGVTRPHESGIPVFRNRRQSLKLKSAGRLHVKLSVDYSSIRTQVRGENILFVTYLVYLLNVGYLL